jgi:[ribosomal protein S18]-alanine N-acetyltransferase
LNFVIRSLQRDDIPEVLEVQGRNPSAAQWKPADYDVLFSQSGYFALIAAEESDSGLVLGFAVFRQVLDEAELLNLAVGPSRQRQGIGRTLVQHGIRRLAQTPAQRLFLEVAASNQPAQRLYQSLGFKSHSVRKRYYENSSENACVLQLEIPRD